MFRQGTVKWYDDNEHYGFLIPDGEEEKDIFFHKNSIMTLEQVLEKGQRVEFDIEEKENKLEAINVRPLEES